MLIPWIDSVRSIALVLSCVTSLSALANNLQLTQRTTIEERNADVIGQAYSLDSPVLLYHELHYFSDDRRQHRVEYYSANGNLLAEKDIDYSKSPLTPAFSQKNFNTGETISVNWQNSLLSISHRDGLDKQPVTSVIQPRYPLVIDAGFDHFIREHWQQLTQGESSQFHFPVAARQGLIKLRVSLVNCQDLPESYYCFRIEANNVLLRWLLEPIELTYRLLPTYNQSYTQANQQAIRLERFRGLANLNDSNGRGMSVDIRYSYGPTRVF